MKCLHVPIYISICLLFVLFVSIKLDLERVSVFYMFITPYVECTTRLADRENVTYKFIYFEELMFLCAIYCDVASVFSKPTKNLVIITLHDL